MEEKMIGPRTSHKEFFLEHLDLTRPEFSGIAEAVANGDIAKADKIFADAMRFKNPQKDKLLAVKKKEVASLSQKAIDGCVARAKDIMDYKVISCGIPWHFADHKIDWEFNPTYNAYKEWPWQLSRHPEWNVLSNYYLLTGDENAAKTYADMLDSWLKQAVVPVDLPGGATWCWRTIEAGIRLMSWIFQISVFVNSPSMSDKLITEYYISLYEHGWRLRTKCTHGNWLIMEMHGLLKAALTGYFFKESKEWYDYAIGRLCAELDIQVYPDGFQYELSSNYHNVVDSNYTSILTIFNILEIEPPKEITERLEKLFNTYVQLARPNRTLPDINDGHQISVVRKSAIAASLYPDRQDFKWFATDGKEGKEPEYTSFGFPYSGCAVMRSSWAKDAVWGYMDCSPFGRGHQHEDKLNVLVDAYGKTLLTEGGCYDYDSSEMRKYVLSTRAHNTAMLNGKEQNQRPTYKWADEDIFKKADYLFETNADKDVAEATFTAGYGADLEKMTHTRKLIFVKDAEKYGLLPFFAVIDRFKAEDCAARKYEIMWHMEECALDQAGSRVSGDFGDGIGLTVAASDEKASFVNMTKQYEPYYQGWFPIRPSGPHEHRPIPTPVLVGEFEGEKRVVTLLYPYKDARGNDLAAVKACSDVNSTDFTVVLADGKEITFNE